MNKIFSLIAVFVMIFAAFGCGNRKLSAEELSAHNIGDSLRVALANADTMYSLLFDVTVGLQEIVQLEHLLNADLNRESPNTRADIIQQMRAIKRGLRERRQRIEYFEQHISTDSVESAKVRALRHQINMQTVAVDELSARLVAANIKIEELQDSLVDLTVTMDSVQTSLQNEIETAYGELNAVYYVIGNKSELKAHGFKQGGTIFKQSKLGRDFDLAYMTRADKRDLTRIPLDAKKAKILSDQPEDTYILEKDSLNLLTLVIVDADKFWALRDFLVIEVK